jgi:PPM family protein phosphatase
VKLGQFARETHAGRKRRQNEDAFVVQPPLFAIADGMGGAQAGELASRLAAEALGENDVGGTAEEQVAALVQEANRRVYQRSSEDAAVSGMGTTATVAIVDGSDVVLGHVGDSRAYRLRNGSLEQLTQDHSLVAELLRDGRLSPEEAESHPQRSVITRALGTDPDVDVDVLRIPAEEGDVFLLCSDGLTTMVGDAAILRIVEDNRRDLREAARALVQSANAGGGEDNITVILFEVAPDSTEIDETLTMPAAEEQRAPEDEDTLSGLEGLPTVEPEPAPAAVDTMVVPPAQATKFFDTRVLERPDAQETAEAPETAEEQVEPGESDEAAAPPSRRRRRMRRLLALLLVLVVAAAIVALTVWGLVR